MLKKIALAIITLTLVFTCSMAAQADISQEEMYTVLQEQLHNRLNGVEGATSFENLARAFGNLGSYKKSTQFRFYTSILADTEALHFDTLETYTRVLTRDAAFCAQLAESGYPTVDELTAYALGLQAQAAGDWPAAISYYEQSIDVLDSMARLAELLMAEPVVVAEGVVHGNYIIDVYSDRTCTIKSYTGHARVLDVPGAFDGYPVTAIGTRAFAWNSDLTHVTLPDSIVSIRNEAFLRCTGLASITLPANVSFIGDEVFEDTALVEINVSPENATFSTIDGVLFNIAEKELIRYPSKRTATTYTIPSGILIISNGAFEGSRYLTSIILPDGILSIGDDAFQRCSSLISIDLPDTITSIGASAFANCRSLSSVTLPDSITSISADAFSLCTALASIVLPDSVSSIDDFAFYECTSLTFITLHNGITSLGRNPFFGCDKLTNSIVPPDHPTFATIDGVLYDKTSKKLISYPRAYTAENYAIPQEIQVIGEYAFRSNAFLTSVILHSNVTSIEDSAFNGCSALTSIYIPNGVTSIGSTAFDFCESLTTITLPVSISHIDKHAFLLRSISEPAEYISDVVDYPTLNVPFGSYAHQYAIDNNIPYTTY